jgi:Replication stress response SDE2 C-terminal
LRLHEHEMKFLPKIATAVGENLLIQQSSSSELVDNNDTDNIYRKDNEDNNSSVDDIDRKPPAIAMNVGITSGAHVQTSSGSAVQVKDSKDRNTENAVASDSPMDLHQYNSASELEALGLQQLKAELIKFGLKCGGTLQERAARLYAIRDIIDPNDYPTKLLAPTKNRM